MAEDHLLNKSIFHIIFIIAALICVLAITQTVIVGALGFSGLDGGHPIVTTCTNFYWSVKYLDIQKILQTAFIHLILSAVFSIILIVILISIVLKLKNDQIVTIDGMKKVLLYFSASLTVYFAIVPGGQYLMFEIEVDNCTSVYNSTRLLAIAILGMILVGLSLVGWILLLIFVYDKTTDRSEKYKEVVNSQTEPNQPKPYQQQRRVKQEHNYVYESRKNQQNNPRRDHHQQTNQHLYDSPSKKAIAFAYTESRNQEVHQSRQPYESRTRSNMPVLEPKESQHDRRYLHPTESRFKNSQHRGYQRNEPRQDEGLVYKKESRSPQRSKYMEELLKESKGYLNKHGKRSVIDSEVPMQERDSRGSDYGRQGHNDNRRVNRSPEREGVLLNYIRGKYAG